METEQRDDIKDKISDWLPVALILGGLVLIQVGIDGRGVVMSTGFLVHGTIGLFSSISRGYHNGLSRKSLKLLLQLAIIYMAVASFINPGSHFIMLLLVVLDKVLLTQERLEPGKQSGED